MSDGATTVITIVSALIGAVIGSIGTTFTSYLLSNRAERQRRRRSIIQRYLIQLQFSLELLSSRFDNFDKGRIIMAGEYFETTTLYALGRVLAYKQILDMEAVGSDMVPRDALIALDKKLDELNNKMSALLFRYDRLTLAETLIEKEEQYFRVITFLEFRQRYDDTKLNTKKLLNPVVDFIRKLDDPSVAEIKPSLENIMERLKPYTST